MRENEEYCLRILGLNLVYFGDIMDKNTTVCFEKIKKAIDAHNANALKDISTECTLQLALTQEKHFFYSGLISYALSKILVKPRYGRHAPPLLRRVRASLDHALGAARVDNEKDTNKALETAMFAISELEKIDRRFVHDVIEKGRTKIAAVLYAEGMSLDSAIALTSAQRHEVMSYSGQTMMADRFGKTLSVHERMKKARELFK
jgi:hypothetical protein